MWYMKIKCRLTIHLLMELREKVEDKYTIRLNHQIDSRNFVVYGDGVDCNNKAVILYHFTRYQKWEAVIKYEGPLLGIALVNFNSYLDNADMERI